MPIDAGYERETVFVDLDEGFRVVLDDVRDRVIGGDEILLRWIVM